MPPKKSQVKEKKAPKSSQKCNFHNRGYCKSKDECDKNHSDIVCNNKECDEEKCNKRHPYQCKYGMHCKFNKKNGCLYSHVTLASDDVKIASLNKDFNNKLSNLENTIVIMQNELVEKNSIIKDLKEKMNSLEEAFSNLKVNLKDNHSKTIGLEMKLDEVENKQKNDKHVKDKKLKELESVIKQKQKQAQAEDEYKCSECDSVFKTKNGLKTHKVRMHTQTKNVQYPLECEYCDAKLENETVMKEHLKLHLYKKSTFKCEDCEFCSENFLTMEVHVGKYHSEKEECGMCNFVAKDLEALSLHISTCQVYVCDDCYYRTVHIHEIKEHLKNVHTSQYDTIIHGKVSLKDPELIDHVHYSKQELCSSN